jgi:hypothetical protein
VEGFWRRAHDELLPCVLGCESHVGLSVNVFGESVMGSSRRLIVSRMVIPIKLPHQG